MATAAKKAKRVKQVFADCEAVAHVWAQQTQDYGRNPHGNCYFEGATIFSYGSHFPMARFVATKNGRRVVLINRNSYSVTTTRHQSAVEDALRGLDVEKIYVDDVREYASVANNLELLWADVIRLAKQHEKARREDFRPQITKQLRNLACYARFVRKGRTKQLAALLADSDRNPQFWAPLAKVSPKSAAAIDAEKAERQAKLDAKREQQQAAERARYARQDAFEAAVYPFAAEAWRSGRKLFTVPAELAAEYGDCIPEHLKVRGSDLTETGDSWGLRAESYAHAGPTLLRIVGDEIQTSRGARVTVRAAVRAWPHLKAHQVPPQPVGQFTAERFEGGILYIGCHAIPVAEMNCIAKQLGLEGEIGDNPAH